jgi:hypothetical protein
MISPDRVVDLDSELYLLFPDSQETIKLLEHKAYMTLTWKEATALQR